MAGGGDDAATKERWFMEKFGVEDAFTPDNPVCSRRGAVVTNIAHIPAALTAVMALNATMPDFAPEGSLALKPWFGRARDLELPPELDLPNVVAMPPYDQQIAELNRQIGAVLPRQSMKDASGVSQMDPLTQVSSLRGMSILQAAQHPMEDNLVLALLGRRASERDRALVDVAVGAHVNLTGTVTLAAVDAARAAGNTPNTVIAAALAIAGPGRAEASRHAIHGFIDLFTGSGLSVDDTETDLAAYPAPPELRALAIGADPDPIAEAMLAGLAERGVTSMPLRWLATQGGHPQVPGVVAAIAGTLVWKSLAHKEISRITAEELPWWLELFGTMIGAAAPTAAHTAEGFCGIPMAMVLGQASVTELAAAALLGERPSADILDGFAMLTGLLLTNGPGAITAQGAKGAVSADGPQTPERIQLNKAMIGFLTHAGYAHGGNGFEGIAFLLERFAGTGLVDPGDPAHGVDLDALAKEYAVAFAELKTTRKELGADRATSVHQPPGLQGPGRQRRPARRVRPHGHGAAR